MDTQSFDSTATGSIPTDWQQYPTGSSSNFSVADNPSASSFLSPNNVLVSAELPNTDMAAAWDNNSQDVLTNAQVTAAVYISGLTPTIQLVARGLNLNSSTPSYYGLSYTQSSDSGPVLQLVRVDDGTSVNLLQYEYPNELPSDYLTQLPTEAGYLSAWVQETLYVDGDNVQASIYRTDTGQYLNSDGQWQVLPTYAVNLIDPDPLTNAGVAGFVRPSGSGYSSAAGYLDNFAVQPVSVDPTPPSVSLSVPGGTLSGTVAIKATPTEPIPNYSITQLAFYVDDNPNYPLLSYLATSPSSGSQSTWNFDTNSLSNGTHTLLIVATDNEGNIGTATATITVSNNTTLSMPSTGFPPNQNSVGITELDYGNDDDDDATLLENDVDVVVGGPADLDSDVATIHDEDPSVQQLVYTNVSNLAVSGGNIANVNNTYTDPLLSFLNYAEANDENPEGAFYHVEVATPFVGGGHSTLPVDQFWGVYAGGSTLTNYTGTAYTGASISFGDSANDALYIGYLEPYWEINFDLTTAASGGWTYALEYPTAVDSDNNPTSWGTITPLTDTTDGFTETGQGQITFNAPSNWVPASIDSSFPMYYMRIVTVTSGTAPVASTIKGENYTNTTTSNGVTTGTIPAYDWALNSSGGYLNPSQYAIAVAAGDTAHFGYQSRLFYDGSMRFYTNPANSTFKAWAISYYPSIVTGNQYANGLFLDNSGGIPPDQYISNIEGYDYSSDEDPGVTAGTLINLREPTGTYSTDYAALLNEIGQQLADDNSNYWIMANTGTTQQPIGSTQAGQTDADPVISKIQSYYDEFNLAAWSDDTSQFQQLYNQVYYRANTDNTEYAVMDSTSTASGDSDTEKEAAEETGQTQLTTLAAYYILAPNSTSQGALDFYGGEETSTYWEVPSSSPPAYYHWSPAAGYNIGAPASPLPSTPEVLVKNGSDPENSDYTFNVYERSFTGTNGDPVLVVYKTVSQDGDSEGNTNDPGTATTVNLGGSYYVLQSNGTLSSTAVTSISLENGEGAILVEEEAGGPDLAATAKVNDSGLANAPASALPSTASTSVSPSSQGSSNPTSAELLAAESMERLLPGLFTLNAAGSGLLADQGDASAELDYFLSQWTAEKLTASLAGSNGPAANSVTDGSQRPLPVSYPPANRWLGSLRSPKPSNEAPFDESPATADNVVAASPVDDPLPSSSAT